MTGSSVPEQMDNPYKPPMARLRCQSEQLGSLVKAVIAGVLIDIGGTWSLNIFLLNVHAFCLFSQGLTEQEVSRNHYFMTIYSGAGLFLPFSRIVMSIVAGYCCAALAKQRIIRAALMISLLSSLIGFSYLNIRDHYYSSIQHLWLTALCFPILCFGVYLYARGRSPRKRKKVQATWTMTD